VINDGAAHVYIFYNKERAAEAEQKLTITLANLYNELKSGKLELPIH